MLDYVEYERWIRMSKETLRSARGDLERGDYNWACFKAQQAAEFAVKALSYGLGEPLYGHSVSGMLKRLSMTMNVDVPQDIMQAALILDRHYIPTRYPNAWHEGIPTEYYSRVDAEESINYAKKIIDWVESVWKSLRGG